MDLFTRAEKDLRRIYSNPKGPGRSVTIKDPDDNTAEVRGITNDITQMIDPDTGQAVIGRSAQVSIPIGELTDAGLGIPKHVPEKTRKPWRVTFNDIFGKSYTFRIVEGNPDRFAGRVLCILEHYKDA